MLVCLRKSWAVVWLLLVSGAAMAAPDHCFGPNSLSGSDIRVLQLAPPPVLGKEQAFANWPATDIATQQVPLLLRPRSTQFSVWWTQWANRCHHTDTHDNGCREGTKGNWIAPKLVDKGVEIRPYFTSFERADGCTLLQAEYALGADSHSVQQRAAQLGLTMAFDRETLASKADQGRLTDICAAPEGRLPADVKGGVLDYEVADLRSPAQTLEFLTQYAALFHRHGRKVIVLPNPLNARTQAFTGFDASNANRIHRIVDKLGIFLWHRSRERSLAGSFEAQLELLKGPDKNLTIDPTHLIVEFELSQATIEDAKAVRLLMARHGIKDLVFWRNRSTPGGDCSTPVNKRIACVLFGNC